MAKCIVCESEALLHERESPKNVFCEASCQLVYYNLIGNEFTDTYLYSKDIFRRLLKEKRPGPILLVRILQGLIREKKIKEYNNMLKWLLEPAYLFSGDFPYADEYKRPHQFLINLIYTTFKKTRQILFLDILSLVKNIDARAHQRTLTTMFFGVYMRLLEDRDSVRINEYLNHLEKSDDIDPIIKYITFSSMLANMTHPYYYKLLKPDDADELLYKLALLVPDDDLKLEIEEVTNAINIRKPFNVTQKLILVTLQRAYNSKK